MLSLVLLWSLFKSTNYLPYKKIILQSILFVDTFSEHFFGFECGYRRKWSTNIKKRIIDHIFRRKSAPNKILP